MEKFGFCVVCLWAGGGVKVEECVHVQRGKGNNRDRDRSYKGGMGAN